jgi:hypothetical protein
MNTSKNTPDQQAIDLLTKAFFGVFNNVNRAPDFTTIKSISIPETIIIKKNGTDQVVYNLETFIEPRQKILTDGTLTAFSENEISSETNIIDHIAQRYSRYEKSGYMSGKYFKEYGNKFFQFIKTSEGWKINSLIWQDDI